MNFVTKVEIELNELKRRITELKKQIDDTEVARREDRIFIKTAQETLQRVLDYEKQCRNDDQSKDSRDT